MFSKNITPEQRLQKAVVAIMAHPRYRYLSGLLLVGSREVSRTYKGQPVPTACTNGRDEIYNPDFIAQLSDPELRFLILHECGHKLYRHLTTWRWMFELDAKAGNQACDYVLNIKLVDENKVDRFATMTGALTMGCLDEKYRDWDSAKVFHDLRKNPPPDGGGGGGGSGEGFDHHDWDGAEEMSDEDKRALAREIDSAIRQGALLAAKTGSGGDRSFDELLQPQVNWRDALRDFVTSTCTGSDYSSWKRPNRRYIGAGHYMPSGITEQVEELVIAPDMSGSTYAPGVLPAFMSEVKSICDVVKPKRVHILYWDTKITRAEVYEQHELDGMINTTKPSGGGGTIVECVPEYLAKQGIKPQAAIVLTDGYIGATWGQWPCPVMWCVIDNKACRPSHGTTVHIKASDF
jgi:predicted metal-dependent peptidase